MKTIFNHFINLIGLLIVSLIGIFLLDLCICTVISFLNGVSIGSVTRSLESNAFFWVVWFISAIAIVGTYLNKFNY